MVRRTSCIDINVSTMMTVRKLAVLLLVLLLVLAMVGLLYSGEWRCSAGGGAKEIGTEQGGGTLAVELELSGQISRVVVIANILTMDGLRDDIEMSGPFPLKLASALSLMLPGSLSLLWTDLESLPPLRKTRAALSMPKLLLSGPMPPGSYTRTLSLSLSLLRPLGSYAKSLSLVLWFWSLLLVVSKSSLLSLSLLLPLVLRW